MTAHDPSSKPDLPASPPKPPAREDTSVGESAGHAPSPADGWPLAPRGPCLAEPTAVAVPAIVASTTDGAAGAQDGVGSSGLLPTPLVVRALARQANAPGWGMTHHPLFTPDVGHLARLEVARLLRAIGNMRVRDLRRSLLPPSLGVVGVRVRVTLGHCGRLRDLRARLSPRIDRTDHALHVIDALGRQADEAEEMEGWLYMRVAQERLRLHHPGGRPFLCVSDDDLGAMVGEANVHPQATLLGHVLEDPERVLRTRLAAEHAGQELLRRRLETAHERLARIGVTRGMGPGATRLEDQP